MRAPQCCVAPHGSLLVPPCSSCMMPAAIVCTATTLLMIAGEIVRPALTLCLPAAIVRAAATLYLQSMMSARRMAPLRIFFAFQFHASTWRQGFGHRRRRRIGKPATVCPASSKRTQDSRPANPFGVRRPSQASAGSSGREANSVGVLLSLATLESTAFGINL